MPNNNKIKKLRGRKYNLRINGVKVNFKSIILTVKKSWSKDRNISGLRVVEMVDQLIDDQCIKK